MGIYVFALFFLAGGVVFGLIGRSCARMARRQQETWRPADGVVIDLAERSDSDGDPLFAPVYRYKYGLREYTATSAIASRPARYKVGDRIPLLLDPENPQEAAVADGASMLFAYAGYGAALLCTAVALLATWLGYTGRITFE